MRVHTKKTYSLIVMASFKQTFRKNENNVISILLSKSFMWIVIIFGRKLWKLFTWKHTYRMYRKGPLIWTWVQISGHWVQISGHWVQITGHNWVQITGHLVQEKKNAIQCALFKITAFCLHHYVNSWLRYQTVAKPTSYLTNSWF